MYFIVVKWQTKPEWTDRFMDLVKDFTEATRAEPGCLHYNLHQKLEEPNTFFIIDGWANQAAVASPAKNPHLAKVMKELGPLRTFGRSLTFTSRVSD